VLPVADTALVARLADGVVVAVRSGATEKTELADAVAALSAVGARLLGTVLTAAPAATDGRYLQQVRHEAARHEAARREVARHDVVPPEIAQHPVGLGRGRTAPPVISAVTPAHGVAMPGWSSVPLEPRQPVSAGQPIPDGQSTPQGRPIPFQQTLPTAPWRPAPAAEAVREPAAPAATADQEWFGAPPHSRREARRLAQLYPEPGPGVRPPPPPHTISGSPLAPPNQLPPPHPRP
jgi:hypothetical protein